jgi:hypothetical protein
VVAEGLAVDPVHPDKTTMMIATTRDRFVAEPVVAIVAHPLYSWQHEGCSCLV